MQFESKITQTIKGDVYVAKIKANADQTCDVEFTKNGEALESWSLENVMNLVECRNKFMDVIGRESVELMELVCLSVAAWINYSMQYNHAWLSFPADV